MVSTTSEDHSHEATSLRDVLCGSLRSADVGRQVAICGWVSKRREHGEPYDERDLDVRDYVGGNDQCEWAGHGCGDGKQQYYG